MTPAAYGQGAARASRNVFVDQSIRTSQGHAIDTAEVTAVPPASCVLEAPSDSE